MVRFFGFLLMLYPRQCRAEFGDEMRAVFVALAGSRRPGWRFLAKEYGGLLRGAACERWREWSGRAPSMAGGALFASAMQMLLYWYLLPGRGKAVGRVLEHLFSRLFLVCLAAGIAWCQPAKQDAATLDLARSIYSRSFTALREAETLDELRRLSDNLDAPEWISVDRFGRTVLTKKDADRDLEALLALPPERRVTRMDILWAEQDADRLTVVAWMMVNEAEQVDPAGEFGPPGARHKLTRATLIRDLFMKTADGWRRIRHDKLSPNDLVLAVDSVVQIMPPLDERHRAVPAR